MRKRTGEEGRRERMIGKEGEEREDPVEEKGR